MGQPSFTNAGGLCVASAPDVCKTPAPPGPPVPTPYPNMAAGTLLNAGTLPKKVKVAGGAPAVLGASTTVSNGDEAGVAGGVVSGKFAGKVEFIQGSMKVRIEGKAAVRVGDPTKHNEGNTVGTVSAPSQPKVLIG